MKRRRFLKALLGFGAAVVLPKPEIPAAPLPPLPMDDHARHVAAHRAWRLLNQVPVEKRSRGAFKRALQFTMDEAEAEWEAHGRDDYNRILFS